MSGARIVWDKGCPRMTVDVARLFDYLVANDWEIVDDVGRADLMLAAACAVHAGAEESGFNALASIDARRKRGSRLVAIGCLPGICDERLLSTSDVIAVPPTRMAALDEIMGSRVKLSAVAEVHDVWPAIDRAQRALGRAQEGLVRRTARAAAQVLAADSLAREIRHAVEKHRSAGQEVCSLRVAWGVRASAPQSAPSWS